MGKTGNFGAKIGGIDRFHGEVLLFRAIVFQALADAFTQSRKPSRQAEKRQAIRWLTYDKDDFFQVCDIAEIDPLQVRKAVKERFNL